MKYYTYPGVVLSSFCGKYWLFRSINKKAVKPFEINETGAFFWKLMEIGAEKELLFCALKEEYDIIDEQQVLQDIEVFLGYLLRRGYIYVKD